jgi:hypothetical protein
MEIVDFHQILGAFLNREENIEKKVHHFSNPLLRSNVPNFSYYMPEIKKLGDYLTLNFEIVVKVTTNLKLDLVDRHGNRLQKDPMAVETHFVRFESIVETFPIRFSTIFKLLKEKMKRNKKLEFKEWTITDFDNYLKGNPHI